MIRCDSIDANVLLYSPHMCLKVGHICATNFCLSCTTLEVLYAVRTGRRSQHMVCRNLKKRVHE